jgi:hypothetical protein
VSPNLAPPTVSSYEFKNFAVEYDVPLGEYMKHYPVESLLRAGHWEFPTEPDPRLRRLGTVVLFEADVKGQAEQEINIHWSLFDAAKGKRLADSTEIDPLCIFHRPSEHRECLSRTPSRQDADVAGLEVWVDTENVSTAQCFFIRLEARHRGSRLTAEDSPKFAASSQAADSCRTG